jgi:hypothetical protein
VGTIAEVDSAYRGTEIPMDGPEGIVRFVPETPSCPPAPESDRSVRSRSSADGSGLSGGSAGWPDASVDRGSEKPND